MIDIEKYNVLADALKQAKKQQDKHPLSNSAKAAYLLARHDMLEYYDEVISSENLENFAVAA